ncbi:hypothetical protein [Aquimonas sp.]|jgi:hypothetical protein|uniref:hypothetical protein n=1 Tax=Aquimonas sp. TaxID=1872588 RepID=UPI0037C10B64
MRTVLPSNLLRLGLRLDAVLSLGAAALALAFAAPLAREIGVASAALYPVAGFMLTWTALTFWMSRSPRLPAWLVWVVLLVNIDWALASFALMATDWIAPSTLGYGLLSLQALAVLAFAEMQWLGLKRSRTASLPEEAACAAAA